MTGEKVVVMTGAASGIGAAAARAFARQGAALVLGDVAEAPLRARADALGAEGARVLAYPVDVRIDASVRAFVAAGVERFGGFDTLCVNAGVAFPETPLTETTDDMIDALLDVNLRGAIYLLRAAIPHLRDGGAVVLTASIAGLQALAGGAVYAATKTALLGLGRSLALETAARRIRVNAVCPGGVDTPLLQRVYGSETAGVIEAAAAANPLGRIADPDDVAEAIVFLASPPARHINGVALRVDGGDCLMGAL